MKKCLSTTVVVPIVGYVSHLHNLEIQYKLRFNWEGIDVDGKLIYEIEATGLT